MRKKLSQEKKRRVMIGVKVDETTKKKIELIADREATPTSTYIYELIKKHIDEYSKYARINWNEEIGKEE